MLVPCVQHKHRGFNMTKAPVLRLFAAVACFLWVTADAALVNQGDGTVKDTATNLVWLENWNANGASDWAIQKAWADGLTFAGKSDWGLPTIDQYAALWATVGGSYAGIQGAFSGVQYDSYWSDTVYAGSPINLAWNFFAGNGFVGFGSKDHPFSAVALRPVPEPQTSVLTLAGLSVVVATAFRRRRKP